MSVTKQPSLISEFQVGQIVELINALHTFARNGSKAVIVSLKEYPRYITIKWVRNKLSQTQMDGNYYPQHFKIITMASKQKLKFLHKNKLISNLEYLEALSEK